jgi:hypothetical protein
MTETEKEQVELEEESEPNDEPDDVEERSSTLARLT